MKMIQAILVLFCLFFPMLHLSGARYSLNVDMDCQFNSIAVWIDAPPGNVYAAYLPKNGVWSKPTIISDVGHHCLNVQVCFDDQGNCVAYWFAQDRQSGLYLLCAAELPKGDSWQKPAVVSSPGEPLSSTAFLKMDHEGNMVMMWESTNLTNKQAKIRFAQGVFGVGWKQPQTLYE
ncbi:MAG: hypothetical protein S4CHLAM2_04460 [Chlamydiales bacterium]|nr:hypothetical protein [Chlamydiales bacterium]